MCARLFIYLRYFFYVNLMELLMSGREYTFADIIFQSMHKIISRQSKKE